MPVRRVTVGGRPAYRWGESGKAYTYDPGDPESRRRALTAARRQGAAVLARGYAADAIGPVAPTAPERVRQLQPAVTHERLMMAVMRRRVEAGHRRLRAALNRALRLYGAPTLGRATDASWRDAALEALRRWLAEETGRAVDDPALREVGERIAHRADASAARAVERAYASVTGERLRVVSLMPDDAARRLVDAWIKDGTSYIVALPEQTASRVAAWVMQTQDEALRVEDLARILHRAEGIEKRHAMLLARDQTGKLNGEVHRRGMQAVGVNRYRWQTSGDERVRNRHAELDGQVFDWDSDGPIVDLRTNRRGHPGHDIQCRCVAIPVDDDLDPELVRLMTATTPAQRDAGSPFRAR